MAEQLMFTPGDFVVYPTHGVGKVISVEEDEIAGHKLELFVISFDRDRMTLRVPVAKVANSGLRKLSSKKRMDEAVHTLKGRPRVKRTMWSRRAAEYDLKINSGDPVLIAEVVRDLHRNVGQPDQSFSERQIYEQARDRLASELAAVEKTDMEKSDQETRTNPGSGLSPWCHRRKRRCRMGGPSVVQAQRLQRSFLADRPALTVPHWMPRLSSASDVVVGCPRGGVQKTGR